MAVNNKEENEEEDEEEDEEGERANVKGEGGRLQSYLS